MLDRTISWSLIVLGIDCSKDSMSNRLLIIMIR